MVPLLEGPGSYIKNATKSTALHILSFYRLGNCFLKKLYNMHVELNKFLISRFLAFMNEMLTKSQDEKRSIQQLFLNYVLFSEYD